VAPCKPDFFDAGDSADPLVHIRLSTTYVLGQKLDTTLIQSKSMPKITDAVWIKVVCPRKALSSDHANGRDGIPVSNVVRDP
jgi:hypothetical protein